MFASNLKILREHRELSQYQLSRCLGVSQSTIGMWESGKREPNYATTQKIAGFFNVSIDMLIGAVPLPKQGFGFSEERDVFKIPVYGKIPAGIPMEAIDDILDYEEAPLSWQAGGKSFFALKISGDSMYPQYLDGDTIIFKKQPTCENGQDCAIMIEDNEATFKRVVRQMNGITCQPLNPAYTPRFFSNEEIQQLPVTVLGVVWELRRSLR